MADVNYNEVTHSIVYTQDGITVSAGGPDPMFSWDARFPDRLSRLRLNPDFSTGCLSPVGRRQQRRARNERSSAAGRYRTQPITFDEIAEVDEDSSSATAAAAAAAAAAATADAESASPQAVSAAAGPDLSKEGKASFKMQMTGFSRSMDGLVSGYFQRAAAGASSTGSDKENTPCEPGTSVEAAISGATGSDVGAAETTAGADGFQMPGLTDVSRHRRKRSNRKLRNRNSVPEEISPDPDRAEGEPSTSG